MFWLGIQALSERFHFSGAETSVDELFPGRSFAELNDADKFEDLTFRLLAGNGLLIGWDGSNRGTGWGSNGVADCGIAFECSLGCLVLEDVMVVERIPEFDAVVGVGATGVE